MSGEYDKRVEQLEDGQLRHCDEIKGLKVKTGELGVLVNTHIAMIHENVREMRQDQKDIRKEMKVFLQKCVVVEGHNEEIKDLKNRLGKVESRLLYASGGLAVLFVVLKFGTPWIEKIF